MKLIETYLQEFSDFCNYGYCLKEEEANRYLKFLISSLKKILNKYKKVTPDLISKINNYRFRQESKRWENNYFENQTLEYFEDIFSKALNDLKLKKKNEKRVISQKWIEWLQSSLNEYLAHFEKRSGEISVDYGKQVNWKNKNKVNKGNHLPSNS